MELEPEPGGLRTSAVKEEGEYILHGAKQLVLNAVGWVFADVHCSGGSVSASKVHCLQLVGNGSRMNGALARCL